MDIPSSSEPAEDSVIFTARRLKAMNLASVSRKSRERQPPASGSTHKRREEDLQTSANSSAVNVKRNGKFLVNETHATPSDTEVVSTFLRTAKGKYCHVFDVPIQYLFDTLKADGVSPKFDHFVKNPSYIIRREPGRSDSDYDVFSKQYIADMLQLWEDIMKPGAWPHILLGRPVRPLDRSYPEMGES